MKTRLVMKFGGTSLMTTERIKNAAQIVADAAADGAEIVVVVSAMGHSTDELIALSAGVSSAPDRRELDALMATGEQVSATLMTMALQNLGCKARSFSGFQAKITTDYHFGDAKIQNINEDVLLASITEGYIPVVTGFQGTTIKGEMTTLGRGGSDTTAIALSAALRADRCDIYTDVDGIYSADPRIVKNAVKLDQVSISEMLELAENGAQVLNARSVELARDKHVTVRVRSTFCPADPGTLLTVETPKAREFTGVTINQNVNCLEIDLDRLELGPTRNLRNFRALRQQTRSYLLRLLSEMGIDAEIVKPKRANPFRILLLLKKADTVTALALLHKSALPIRGIEVISDIAAVVVVATEISARCQSNAVSAITQQEIPLLALAMHRQRLTLLVPAARGVEVTHLVHLQFAGLRLVA